jgi:hypothetical protein
LFDAFRKTLAEEGISAFYKGFGAVAALTMPAHALYFGGYEASKKILQPNRKEEDKSAWVHFTSGLFADVGGSIIWVPMDVIKQRMQMSNSNKTVAFNNSMQAASHILRTEGLRGLYRGSVAAIATFGPYVGLYFSAYEHLKTRYASFAKTPRENLSLPANLICALTASAASAFITCPIDVVKTNLQVYSVSEGGHANTLDAIRSLYRQGGFSIFMRGWNARILWLAPGSAVTMAAYEQCKTVISFLTGAQ